MVPLIPALGRLKQEKNKFEESWGYIMGLCLNKSYMYAYTHTQDMGVKNVIKLESPYP